MNILFFLTPKSEVAYIFEDETLRQTVEKMEHRKFSCIPLLSKDGRYTGTISEGDLLWGIKRMHLTDIKDMEDVSIMAIPRRATYKPVHAGAAMDLFADPLLLREAREEFEKRTVSGYVCPIPQDAVPVIPD